MIKKHSTNRCAFLSAAFLGGFFAAPVWADDIADAIQEGLNYYESGDLTRAVNQLDYASTLIRQQKGEKVVEVLPEPLDGWQADPAQSEATAASMMGGGASASRLYYKGSDAYLEISLVMDSPTLQSTVAMMSNPSMISMSGGKVVKVQGNTGKLDIQDDSVELIFVVNGAVLFTLTGSGVSAAEVQQYASAIQLDKLQK